MNKKKDFHQVFKVKHRLLYQSLLKEYKNKIEKAKEDGKVIVHNEFQAEIYKEYIDVQNTLGDNSRFLALVTEETQKDKTETIASVFNKRFGLIDRKSKDDIVEKLSLMKALDDLIGYLLDERKKHLNPNINSQIPKSSIQWTGDIELEFVQFVYALKEGKYIQTKNQGITKLVNEMASLFNIELGKNWQSNLSKSVRSRKNNYKPEIFKKLEDAFENYRMKRINNDK